MTHYKALRDPKTGHWNVWYMHTKMLGHVASENGVALSFRKKKDAKDKAKAMNKKMAKEGGAA